MFLKILFLNKIVMLYKKHVIAPTGKQTDQTNKRIKNAINTEEQFQLYNKHENVFTKLIITATVTSINTKMTKRIRQRKINVRTII